MKRQTAIQVFALLAIVVAVVISYYPPPANGEAIWALVTGFLAYCIRDLFGPHDPNENGGQNATP